MIQEDYLCVLKKIIIFMKEQKNPEEFYAELKKKLEETSAWPSEYLYKFIVPSSDKKIAEIEALFNNMGAVITTRESAKGKYTSVSVNVKMKTADNVIAKYKEVGEKVEGVISL